LINLGKDRQSPVSDLNRSIVLVGIMGAGKSSIGKRLATSLNLSFVDADQEIEAAAGCSIPDLFELHGEAAFREGEHRVIKRLLDGPVQVIATGGGAYMDPRTRELIEQCGISVWLRADIEVLLKRVARRNNRPLLKTGDPKEIMQRLMEERYPVYGEAQITVESKDGPHEEMVDLVLDALRDYRNREPAS
jgi:shikimate kinase